MGLKVKDIADILNVSPSTVSLVLNNKPGISEETRQKVLKTVEELGYDTNLLSKPALKNNRSFRFLIYKKHGSVVSDTPFFSALIEGIDAEARKNGYNLVISYMTGEENVMDVFRIVEENPLDGILLLATEMNREDLRPFVRLNTPLVVLDSYFEWERVDTLVIHNVQGAYAATKHLIDRGHRAVGYLHSAVWIHNFDERKEGFLKALQDHGIAPEARYTFALESTLEGAYRDMKKWLRAGSVLPTGFFADNDIIAFGAMKAMKEEGIKIPEEVSVVGFDDMPFCAVIEPPLTTVKVYKQRMGMLAVKRLIEKVEGNAPEFIKLEVGTELIERNSVFDISERSKKE